MSRSGTKKKSGVKKALLILWIVIAVAVLGLIGLFFYERNKTGFLRGTTLGGTDISGRTPEEVTEELTSHYTDFDVEIDEDGQAVLTGKASDFGFTIDADTILSMLQQELDEQKNDYKRAIKTLIFGEEIETGSLYSLDGTKFAEYCTSEKFSVERVSTQDAAVVLNDEGTAYEIVEAVQGNEIDDSKLQELVREKIEEKISSGDTSEKLVIDLPDDIYTSEAPKEVDQETLEAELKEKNHQLKIDQYKEMTVTYTFGDSTEVLDGETISGWITIGDDDSVTVDQDSVTSYVASLAEKYDTRYKERTFTTHDGETITFSSDVNAYGYTIDQENEVKQLTEDIQNGESVTRDPVYVSENSYGNPVYLSRNGTDDLNGTYVEVDISEQHVWFYKNGEVIAESDCVTGNTSKGHDTTTGVYPLAYKQSPATLTGGDAGNGYSSEVTYWMPFNDGQGLHDATWRSSFGGEIYKTNGSHGCVNLPYSLAEQIYNNIEAGTAIVVHD